MWKNRCEAEEKSKKKTHEKLKKNTFLKIKSEFEVHSSKLTGIFEQSIISL